MTPGHGKRGVLEGVMGLRRVFSSLVPRRTAAEAPPAAGTLGLREFLRRSGRFRRWLNRIKAGINGGDFGGWYPYDSFSNFFALKRILGGHPELFQQLGGDGPVADVGCADGDLSFFLESLGCKVHAIDHPAPNYNAMQGVKALKAALASAVEIYEIDLDSQFRLPAERYALVLFFGTLYHLKNPFGVLETLARHASCCLLSTRVARYTPDRQVRFEDRPMAYLLDEREANNDPTNYWIFSNTGLRRLLKRAGWEVLGFCNTGNTADSDPASPERDERAFCLVRSRQLACL